MSAATSRGTLNSKGSARKNVTVWPRALCCRPRGAPSPAFARHADRFARYEQAAQQLLLVEIERLEREIDALGLTVGIPGTRTGWRVADLQIMRAGIAFRWA